MTEDIGFSVGLDGVGDFIAQIDKMERAGVDSATAIENAFDNLKKIPSPLAPLRDAAPLKTIGSLETEIKVLKNTLSSAAIGSKEFSMTLELLKKKEKELSDVTKQLSHNTEEYGKKQSGANSAVRDFAGEIPGLSSAINLLTNPLALAGAALTGIGMGMSKAISLAADFEQTTIAFTTMLGSADAAGKMLKDLTEFAAKTPFEQPGIELSAKKLLAFGVTADQVMGTLKMLGDVSAGTGKPLEELSQIYGKVVTKQKATNEELNQFSEAGIPIIKELSGMLGKTGAEIMKMAEKGQITFPMIQTAFKNLSSEGGVFFNLMEKQSGTLAGRWSTFKDSIALTARDMGMNLLPTAGKVLTAMQEIVSIGAKMITIYIDTFGKQIGPIFSELWDTVAAISKEIFGAGDATNVFVGYLNVALIPLKAMLNYINFVVSAVRELVDTWKGIANLAGAGFMTSEDVAVMDAGKNTMNSLAGSFKSYADSLGLTEKSLNQFKSTSAGVAAQDAFLKGDLLTAKTLLEEWAKTTLDAGGALDPQFVVPLKTTTKEVKNLMNSMSTYSDVVGGSVSEDQQRLNLMFEQWGTTMPDLAPKIVSITDALEAMNEAMRNNPLMGPGGTGRGGMEIGEGMITQMNKVKDIVAGALDNLKTMGTDALFSLGEAFGQLATDAKSGADAMYAALNGLMRALLVDVPKMAGIAMIQAAAVTPPPANLGLLFGGLALIGLSGVASGIMKGRGGRRNRGMSSQDVIGGGAGGGATPSGAGSGLEAFNAGGFEFSPVIQIQLDSGKVGNYMIDWQRKQAQLMGA